jgi:hypothetical protein
MPNCKYYIFWIHNYLFNSAFIRRKYMFIYLNRWSDRQNLNQIAHLRLGSGGSFIHLCRHFFFCSHRVLLNFFVDFDVICSSSVFGVSESNKLRGGLKEVERWRFMVVYIKFMFFSSCGHLNIIFCAKILNTRWCWFNLYLNLIFFVSIVLLNLCSVLYYFLCEVGLQLIEKCSGIRPKPYFLFLLPLQVR